MAYAAAQLNTKDYLKDINKAAGGWARAPRTPKQTAVRPFVPAAGTSTSKTRALAQTPNMTASARASVNTPATPQSRRCVGGLRAPPTSAAASMATTTRAGAAVARATRTIATAVATAAATATVTIQLSPTHAAPTTVAATSRKAPAAPTAASNRPTSAIASTAVCSKPSPANASRVGRALDKKTPRVPLASLPVAASAAHCGTSHISTPSASIPSTSTSTTPSISTSTRTSTSSTPRSSPPSHSSSFGIEMPLVLDPLRPNSAAALLKGAASAWDTAVWLIRHGARDLVAKQTPFHSARRAAQVSALSAGREGSSPVVVITEQEARHEAATALKLRGVFVQPLLVLDRPYSRGAAATTSSDDGDEDACPDREIITVTPYFPCGDAGQYIDHVAIPLFAALRNGKRSLRGAVKELTGVITHLARDMFALVSQVHDKGFVLVDHKLENMVYDHVKARWQLIDAAEVRPCKLGKKRMGESNCTPSYAAPEQLREEGAWADSRSDVYTCGWCVRMAVSDCRDRLAAALGEGTKALAAAEVVLGEALKPLAAVVAPCCDQADPARRPSAAAALRKLAAIRQV